MTVHFCLMLFFREDFILDVFPRFSFCHSPQHVRIQIWLTNVFSYSASHLSTAAMTHWQCWRFILFYPPLSRVSLDWTPSRMCTGNRRRFISKEFHVRVFSSCHGIQRMHNPLGPASPKTVCTRVRSDAISYAPLATTGTILRETGVRHACSTGQACMGKRQNAFEHPTPTRILRHILEQHHTAPEPSPTANPTSMLRWWRGLAGCVDRFPFPDTT